MGNVEKNYKKPAKEMYFYLFYMESLKQVAMIDYFL